MAKTDVFSSRYASIYDVIYADKDYRGEAQYIDRVLSARLHDPREILEFGTGTGRHAYELAESGYRVVGIERSKEMARRAMERASLSEVGQPEMARFECIVGDIQAVRIARTFDAVISLFHVMSYQIDDSSVANAFDTASSHLSRGGVFLFDIWHTEAVLFDRPSVMTKVVENGTCRVVRHATPTELVGTNCYRIRYDLVVRDKFTAEVIRFSESHTLRHFAPDEIGKAAASHSFDVAFVEESFSGKTPTCESWSVCYGLRKR